MNKAKPTAWSEYLVRIANTDVKAEISRKTGINDATVGRWLNGQTIRPDVETVVSIARTFGAEPLYALVAVGYLRLEEIGAFKTPREFGLDEYSDLELAEEIVRRIKNGSVAFDDEDPVVGGDAQNDAHVTEIFPAREEPTERPEQIAAQVKEQDPGEQPHPTE